MKNIKNISIVILLFLIAVIICLTIGSKDLNEALVRFSSGLLPGFLPSIAAVIVFSLWRSQRRRIAYADFSSKHCSCILKALNFMVQIFKKCETEFSGGIEDKKKFVRDLLKEMGEEKNIIQFKENQKEYEVFFEKDKILEEINFIHNKFFELSNNLVNYNMHITVNKNMQIYESLTESRKELEDKLKSVKGHMRKYMHYDV